MPTTEAGPKARMQRLLLTRGERAALALLKEEYGDASSALRAALHSALDSEAIALGQGQRRSVVEIPAKGRRYGAQEFDLKQLLWRVRPVDAEAMQKLRHKFDLRTAQSVVRLAVRIAALRRGFTPPGGVW